jgi:hypothetical protein
LGGGPDNVCKPEGCVGWVGEGEWLCPALVVDMREEVKHWGWWHLYGWCWETWSGAFAVEVDGCVWALGLGVGSCGWRWPGCKLGEQWLTVGLGRDWAVVIGNGEVVGNVSWC